jgi:type IV pilus assembly protein PilB
MASDVRKNFGQFLLEKDIIDSEQLKEALDHQKEHGCTLSEAFLDLKHLDDKQLLILLSTYLSIPPIKVGDLNIPEDILKIIPQETAAKYQALPISKIGTVLTVVMSDPLNIVWLDDLERITHCQVNPVIGLRSELKQTIENRYKKSIMDRVDQIIKDSEVGSIEIVKDDEEVLKDDEIMRSVEDAPVIKLTNFILRQAVEESASDVLIEPLPKSARVRYRIDGILREVQTFSRKMLDFVISRIKVIANLNITEHRMPQDGRFRMNVLEREIDFRVSVVPTCIGEKVALRVLDKSQSLVELDNLGFGERLTPHLKNDSDASYGMILSCGPTGCGKTTTLYSILRHIYSPEKNIITVEDPLEYQLEGINQVSVNYEVGLTFAAALRSILRQDPDIIMVGEIRDFDTVDIAIKAALTGHLVLSTLHTTTACGSVTRLVNMGVEPFLLSSTLIGVLAQRLVRRLCPHCRQVHEMDSGLREKYRIGPQAVIYKPKGCKLCASQGYKGRVAVGEYLHLTPDVRRLINDSADERTIKKTAQSHGMQSLRENAIAKMEQGLTSIEEVLRTTMEDQA